jgi:hypothetical protein
MRNPPAWLAGAWGSLESPICSLHDSQATASQAPRAMTMSELIASIAHEVSQPLAMFHARKKLRRHLPALGGIVESPVSVD